MPLLSNGALLQSEKLASRFSLVVDIGVFRSGTYAIGIVYHTLTFLMSKQAYKAFDI